MFLKIFRNFPRLVPYLFVKIIDEIVHVGRKEAKTLTNLNMSGAKLVLSCKEHPKSIFVKLSLFFRHFKLKRSKYEGLCLLASQKLVVCVC